MADKPRSGTEPRSSLLAGIMCLMADEAGLAKFHVFGWICGVVNMDRFVLTHSGWNLDQFCFKFRDTALKWSTFP